MIGYKLDLMWTIFWLYCGYQLYTSLVVFLRHDNIGKQLFQNLQLPIVVAIYFFIPCVALYLTYKTFGEFSNVIFWIALIIIFVPSFFLVFYITTMPEWPIGKFLQIQKVSLQIARRIMSLNFATSLLITIICAIVLINQPNKANNNGSSQIENLKDDIGKIEIDKKSKEKEIQEIKKEKIYNTLNSAMGLMSTIFGLSSAFLTYKASIILLGTKKKRNTK